MKQLNKNIFYLIYLALLSFSCDENVNPKSPFVERYILNFIVRGDTTLQIATLTHNYNTSGLDAYTNTVDPAIKDADIKIWYDNEVYTLRDTLIERADTLRYKGPVYYYYLENFPVGYNKPISVEAELNNGIILSSSTKIPSELLFDSISIIIPRADKSDFMYSWQKEMDGIFFLSRLRIHYKYLTENNIEYKVIEVPLSVNNNAGDIIANYPVVTEFNTITYSQSGLDSTMKWISGDDPEKSNYILFKAEFESFVFDRELSKYFSSTHGYLDDFSVRLDENIYSNIRNGLGIFASYIKERKAVFLKEEYVKSFGYEYDFQ